ncbi:MAG: hypothetical protein ACOCRX_06910 [Candidatus Woesearchaeota archaeon]
MIEAKQKLVDFLIDRYDAKIQMNGIWYKIRCPFCGDSNKHKHSRHLNIRVPNEDNMLVAKCFQPKCDVGGLLTRDHLTKMGMSDSSVLRFVTDKAKINKNIVNKISSTKLHLALPDKPYEEVNKYFKERTNISLNETIIKNYNIVGDFTWFLEKNTNKFKYNKRLLSLSKKEREGYRYIGFLNQTGTFMNVRSINDDHRKHIKIPIVEFPIYIYHKPFAINRNFNIVEKEVYIVLAEGIFDTINISNYLGGINALFVQTGSAGGMYGMFKRLSKFYYVDWMFIRDQDVEIDFFKNIKKYNDYRFRNKAYVVYNELSKDFGEIKKPIRMKKIKI